MRAALRLPHSRDLMATEQHSPEILSSGAGLAAAIAVETGTELGELEPVRARGYWELVWRRFRRDRVAIGGGLFIIFLFLAAFIGAPIAAKILGHGPNDLFAGGTDPQTLLPVGPWTHVSTIPYPGAAGHWGSTLFILGGDGQLGRDEFLRLLYGAQASLEVAIGAMLLSMLVGVVMGSIAGYHGGWIDSVVSRVTEIVMAFPLLLFIIALASTIGDRLDNITLGFLGKGVMTLVLVLGFFGWYYPARIVRAQVILLEAGLSFLGIGIKQPTPSWGSLLSDGPAYYLSQPWLMVWPGLAILLTTLAFNLLGDGLRDAFDPRSSH